MHPCQFGNTKRLKAFIMSTIWFVVFNATFNNTSVISWRSVLFLEYPEKTNDLWQVTDKLYCEFAVSHNAKKNIA